MMGHAVQAEPLLGERHHLDALGRRHGQVPQGGRRTMRGPAALPGGQADGQRRLSRRRLDTGDGVHRPRTSSHSPRPRLVRIPDKDRPAASA